MASVKDQKILKGLTTIFFKSGRDVQGDLSEFAFAQGPKAVSKLFSDKEKVESLFGNGREAMVINLEEVEIIEVKDVRLMLP